MVTGSRFLIVELYSACVAWALVDVAGHAPTQLAQARIVTRPQFSQAFRKWCQTQTLLLARPTSNNRRASRLS